MEETCVATTQPVVVINKTEMTVLKHAGVKVITFKMIDEVHERSKGTAKRNFGKNINRFTEGRHFIRIGQDEMRTDLWVSFGFSKFAATGILITERGYLMLAKSFTDDLAWKVQEKLIDGYFRANNDPAPKQFSLPDLLRMQLDSLDKIEQLEAKAARLEPKAQSFDTFLNTTGTGNFTETAKILGLKPRYFTNQLQEDKILYHIGKALVPYQAYLDRGYFEMVKVSDRNDKKKNRSQARVTSNGLAWLRKKYLPEIGFPIKQDLLEIAKEPTK